MPPVFKDRRYAEDDARTEVLREDYHVCDFVKLDHVISSPVAQKAFCDSRDALLQLVDLLARLCGRRVM